MIVGVCGFIGSGKDTIADYLVNIHQFRRDSFAATLKDAVSAVFGWDRDMLEGRSKKSREWRETRDEWWTKRLEQEITPRRMLQLWGTEVCRSGFHDDIWIASLENKLRNSGDDVVISDCRFPNEISAIKNAGGIVIHVVRGEEPVWYQDCVTMNHGPNRNPSWALARVRMEQLEIHASETAWVGTKFDQIIDNNGTMDRLYQQINDLVQDPPVSKANQDA